MTRSEEKPIRKLKQLPSQHVMAAGTPMCAGCGGLEGLNEASDVLGENTVFVNAAGCMTLLSVYPFTPFRGSFFYTAMASAPAGAQGIRDALDVLIAKGRLPAADDLQVVVLTGDGSAYGMGLSSTSGAIERDLDFLYICYDNEGYGNTGHQSSAATPLGARTATDRGGFHGRTKNLFDIWVAHQPSYVATAVASEPLDLVQKVQRAKQLSGPRLILMLAPCPTGWDYPPERSLEIGKLAVDTGAWPLKEYVDGQVRHTKLPKTRLPVERYLETQGRFAHLFEPQRDEATLRAIQAKIDADFAAIEGSTTAPD
ncbi:MAG: thiamine pyrophosphate-dependent enzyme [Myxococcales bacterium]|nr:thiamine pyrophosphate-dependent enzyme [Myxococcales bacterium]